MAYTNAIFYIDDGLVSAAPGSDAVRTTIAAVVFSNPSGTTVLGTKTAHGLVTGAVITVSGCTQAYANDAWKVTVVDANTFTLDTALWASFNGADVTGDCVPFGGSSWADAWATISSGATAARIAPGDTVRVARSGNPTSIGSATWTDGSKTVTLAAAQTLNVDLCDTNFTAKTGLITILSATPTAGGTGYTVGDILTITTGGTGGQARVDTVSAGVVTVVSVYAGGIGGYTTGTGKVTSGGTGVNCTLNITAVASATSALVAVATDGKQGTNSLRITTPSSVKQRTLMAFRAITPGSLTAYQKLSFWIKNSSALVTGNWRICLCSDAAGVTVVDEFLIPANPGTVLWTPMTIAKTGGGNLGASTASIAIYTDTVAPASSSNILLDNIIACTTSGLSLQSLISKNSLAQAGAEPWIGIQSINGTTVMLDAGQATLVGNAVVYSGTTESVTTYIRETIKMAAGGAIINDSGTAAAGDISFQGGWSVGGAQDGETVYDGLNTYSTNGMYFSTRSFVTISRFCFVRFAYGIYTVQATFITVSSLQSANNNSTNVYLGTATAKCDIAVANASHCAGISCTLDSSAQENRLTVGNCNSNLSTGIFVAGNFNRVTSIASISRNANYGLSVQDGASGNEFNRCDKCSGNVTACVLADEGGNYARNFIMTGTEVVRSAARLSEDAYFWSHFHDQTAYHWGFTEGGTINSLTTIRTGGTGVMWRFNVTSTVRASSYPLRLAIAQIAVVANKLVTVKAWMLKDNATGIACSLFCRGGQLSGVAADVSATKASDTSWEELTITFTPTEAGVIEIEARAWYVNSLTNAFTYIEDLTITQAA